jgi:hypothetical protein
VRAWAEWYRRILPGWIERFSSLPESRASWTKRVLSSRRSH